MSRIAWLLVLAFWGALTFVAGLFVGSVIKHAQRRG